MYHYVRPGVPRLPHFPFLKLADFERQLDYFADTHGLVTREEFEGWSAGGPAPKGVLLTFDDGLRDHVEHVLPVLMQRRLFGLFYVCSGPVSTGRILDVHKVHLILGRLGGPATLRWLQANTPQLLEPSAYQLGDHYAKQASDCGTKIVKQLFNWQLKSEERGSFLDALMQRAFPDAEPSWQDIYIDEEGVRALSEAGMGVGPHSHTHNPASRLSLQQQSNEIELSCRFVEAVGGSRMWGYCYPHGSCTEDSQKVVSNAGLPFAFAVSPRDIDSRLTDSCRFALPRHDCNVFPNGRSSYLVG